MTYLILFIRSMEYMVSIKLQHFCHRSLVIIIITVLIKIETTSLIFYSFYRKSFEHPTVYLNRAPVTGSINM